MRAVWLAGKGYSMHHAILPQDFDMRSLVGKSIGRATSRGGDQISAWSWVDGKEVGRSEMIACVDSYVKDM